MFEFEFVFVFVLLRLVGKDDNDDDGRSERSVNKGRSDRSNDGNVVAVVVDALLLLLYRSSLNELILLLL